MNRFCAQQSKYSFTARVVILVVAVLAAITQITTSADGDTGTSLSFIYDAFGDNAEFEKDWGFSAVLHHDGMNILIDTGNDPEILASNVAKANVDLAEIDAVVLTHRHMDHLAGLPVVLAGNPDVPVYGPEEAFSVFGSQLASSFYDRDGSLPMNMRYFDGEPPGELHFDSAWHGARITTVSNQKEIFPGVHVIANRSEKSGSVGIVELSLAVETPRGLVVIVGCSHPGVAEIVERVQYLDGSIALVTGGFHMPTASVGIIEQTSKDLEDLGVRSVAPAHCTGEPAMALLRRRWGHRFIEAGVGRSISIADLPVAGLPVS
jgi:7,8-dihydropterin-6-yl-methyl-4-(beta-D-ribofuranosyl)aminobenzene 5'-phosphate synthase